MYESRVRKKRKTSFEKAHVTALDELKCSAVQEKHTYSPSMRDDSGDDDENEND